jgi:hypothetical protein
MRSGSRDDQRHRNASARVIAACLSASMVTIVLGGSLLAQSPSASVEPSTAVQTAVPDPFPSAEEISDILGVDVEARGIQDSLSQIWEGTNIDWQALPSAQLQFYFPSVDESQAPVAGVIIDVAHFGSVDDAVQHVDDAVFDANSPSFETELSGDYVTTASFESDDGFGGSFMFIREGPVVVSVMAMATGATEMEAVTEAVVALVLSRLHGDS